MSVIIGDIVAAHLNGRQLKISYQREKDHEQSRFVRFFAHLFIGRLWQWDGNGRAHHHPYRHGRAHPHPVPNITTHPDPRPHRYRHRHPFSHAAADDHQQSPTANQHTQTGHEYPGPGNGNQCTTGGNKHACARSPGTNRRPTNSRANGGIAHGRAHVSGNGYGRATTTTAGATAGLCQSQHGLF